MTTPPPVPPPAAAEADGTAPPPPAPGRASDAAPRRGARPGSRRAARLVTDGFEPKNWIIALTLLVGWRVDGLAGVGWGLFGALFAAVIPVLFITFGIRRGTWADRHLGVRQQRLVVMVFIVASVATGTALMGVLGAPRPMIALVAAMISTLVVLMAITVVWKVSVHAAVSSGSVALLALAYGPWLLAAYPLVALVGWSRVALRDHTPAQVLAGTALGAAVAAGTYALLRG
ncbi:MULTISPECIES: phosphatase PAP2 family protein [Streptomyces]|uniref:phosphatase PAP2 family protein n=1 Tax=Streptomyces TaxID=1883 RepID=UPI002249181B|nr:phosphatase PAP2 family protein [Streptomyces sp. JHD 1]MCX2968241.1 phosphatase PAP2 family protein [Streptomyces sp. JHD 1]